MATISLRNGRSSFYVRVFIPADLQAQIGRREISRSLSTSDPSLAECRSKVADAKAAILFHTVRRNPGMTLMQIRILVSRYIGERLDEWEQHMMTADLDCGFDGEADELGYAQTDMQDTIAGFCQENIKDMTAALRGFAPAEEWIMDEFLKRYKLAIDKGSASYQMLGRELMKAERIIAEKVAKRVQGEYHDAYSGNGDGPVPSTQPEIAPELCVTLSKAIPAYLAHFAHRAPGTIEAKRNVMKRFLEIVGDKQVHTISKNDCIHYRDTLTKLPANASKRFPGMPLAQVIEKAKHHPEFAPLSKVTISQDLTHLITFFAWLIDEGKYIGANPAEGLAYEGVETKAHEAYSDADIKVIFGSDEFKEQKTDKVYSSRYWLPLILLHTGARREEIANLALADIRKEDNSGVWYFDITPDLERGRRIKNKSSRRHTPIHSQLVKAGLLDYVEARRSKGETLLFTKRNTVKGRATAGDAVSKWWHRLMRRLRIPGEKTLHGLRPTVNTRLHESGCDPETRRNLLGHSGKDVNETVYLRLSLTTLSENLEKMKYIF